MSELYTEQLQEHLRVFEKELPAHLPAAEGLCETVARAMTYACEAGGKRIRPVLTLEFCRLACGDAGRAMPFATAVELIHSYSLVHDDLPCMDDSPLRRGKPSVHAAFGEDMALLAGDALLTLAFEVMLRADNRQAIPAESVLAAAFTLAKRAGYAGMVGGQVIDLQSEGKAIGLPVLEKLQQGKTAALMIAACRMGAIIGGGSPEQVEAAARFGEQVGLGFQIVDDILDVTATTEELGKPVGSDAENDKTTFITLYGLEGARSLAKQHNDAALAALADLGPEADFLREMAVELLTRSK